MAKLDFHVIAYVLIGIVIYAAAILTTFGAALWQRTILGPTAGPLLMIVVTSLAGLGMVAIGYFMIRVLGGSASLRLTKLMTHLTRSKQVIEIRKNSIQESSGIKRMIVDQVHWFYIPILVFISAIGLGWDFHNANSPKAGFFHGVAGSFDIFSRPAIGTSPIVFSRHLIPALVILTIIAGLVPALVLPYFSKFKVTGVNAGPFHTTLLFSFVGVLAGVGVILTLIGLFYRSLWLNRAPLPYHFGILALLGFSLHLSLGMYLGMQKAEAKIMTSLQGSESGKLMVIGKKVSSPS